MCKGPEVGMSLASWGNRRKLVQVKHGGHRYMVWDETGCWIKIFSLKWQRFRKALQSGVFEIIRFFQLWLLPDLLWVSSSRRWVLSCLQVKSSQNCLTSCHLLLSFAGIFFMLAPPFPYNHHWSLEIPLWPGQISHLARSAYLLTSDRARSTLR